MSNIDDIKKLSPEERITRLKKLEEDRNKEIEEARKLMTDSIVEVETKKKDYMNIPIPQLKAVDTTTLFGKAEKEIFSAKRFNKGSIDEQANEEHAFTELEQAVKDGGSDIPQQDNPYGHVLEEIKNELYTLNSNSNWGESEKSRFYDAQNKLEDLGQKYQSVGKYVSNLMSVSAEMQNKLKYVK